MRSRTGPEGRDRPRPIDAGRYGSLSLSLALVVSSEFAFHRRNENFARTIPLGLGELPPTGSADIGLRCAQNGTFMHGLPVPPRLRIVSLPVGLLEFRRRKDSNIGSSRPLGREPPLVEKAHIDETRDGLDSADPRSRFSLPSAAGKERTHTHTIRLKLRDMNQLFNSMDPSPFIERDLDDDAEEFIVSWAQECPSNASIRLRIYLDQWPAEDPKELIKTAVHNHFSHRVQIARLEFKRLLEQGRTSLFIGLLFLAACLILTNLFWGALRARGLPSRGRASRLPDGWRCGDRCRFIFTIGGPCCGESGSIRS